MKKLILAVTILTLVSCGKNELLNNSAKALLDGAETTAKAIDDTFSEVDRSLDSVITKANDAKNEVLSNTGNLSEAVGEIGEGILQSPKIIVNTLLGNDSEELADDIDDLQDQVDEIYQEMLQSFSDLSESLGDVKGDLSDLGDTVTSNQQGIVQALEDAHTELLEAINRLDRKDRRALRKIRRLQSRLRNLGIIVQGVRNDLNNLEVFCETYIERFRYYTPIITNVEVACELVNGTQER